jgi:hypothetical protein
LRGGITGLTNLFLYLVDMYCYASAGECIAAEHTGSDAGFWRYRIRNYHFYDFISRYYSFLDHAAYFVASLTLWKLLEGTPLEHKGTMYYGTFWPILKGSLNTDDRIGYLNTADRKMFLDFLRGMDIEPNNPRLNKIARHFRQDSAHLVFPGIDHITQTITPLFEKDGKKSTYKLGALQLSGAPKYSFKDLMEFAETVLPLIDTSFETMTKTGIVEGFLENSGE